MIISLSHSLSALVSSLYSLGKPPNQDQSTFHLFAPTIGNRPGWRRPQPLWLICFWLFMWAEGQQGNLTAFSWCKPPCSWESLGQVLGKKKSWCQAMPPDQLSPSPRGWTEASACLFLTCPGWFQGVAMSKSHCCSVFAAALLEVTTSHPRCRSSNTPSIALPQGLWKDSLPSGILFPPESCLLASLLPSFCCKYLFIIPFWATPYKIGPPTYPSTPAPLTAFFFP